MVKYKVIYCKIKGKFMPFNKSVKTIIKDGMAITSHETREETKRICEAMKSDGRDVELVDGDMVEHYPNKNMLEIFNLVLGQVEKLRKEYRKTMTILVEVEDIK